MKINQKLKIALRNILMTCGEVKTDKAVLLFDGELGLGLEVFVEVDGEVVPAEDGEYATEDGKVIVVKDGKVEEIREPEAQEPEAEPVIEEELSTELAEEPEVLEPAAEPIEEPETEPEAEVSVEDRIAGLEAKFGDMTTALETILNSISAFETRISELESKLAKVSEEPAAEPIEDANVEEQEQHTRAYYLRKQK